MRYYEDSEFCRGHIHDRPPRFMQFTFSTFHPQPRRMPEHRFNRHANVFSEFQASPYTRRLAAFTPPNRVRFTTDCQFASGCSPPRLMTTQLPSATELWHSPTGTFTLLMNCPCGRTSAKRSLAVFHRIPDTAKLRLALRVDGARPTPHGW